MLNAWVLLTATILFEVAGTISMKLSAGFTNPLPSFLIFVFYGISFTFLTFTLKTLEVSTVYAMWSGLGTCLVAILGVAYFKEVLSTSKSMGIALVILGVILIHLSPSK